MKKIKFIFLCTLFFVLSCEEKEDLSKCAEIEILEMSTSQPANVSIFFQLKDCNNKPIAGLTEEDFEIYENDDIISEYEAERRINPISQKFVYNTILYLDLSGSILQSESLSSLKNAAISFIDEIMPTSSDPNYGAFRLGIAWFDGAEEIHLLIDMTEDISELKNAVSSITSSISSDNSTNLYGAVLSGISTSVSFHNYFEGENLISTTSLVFFTDGTDRANYYEFTEVESTINDNTDYTSYYTIGLGGEIDESVLSAIGKNGFEYAGNLSQLTETFNRLASTIKEEVNSYYLLEYCSPTRSGYNALKITVKGYSGNSTESFDADGFTGGCNL
jgi:hypothetical protein